MGRRAATIKRAPHDKDNPYKMIRRATLEDGRLSWEARGVIGYLLMKPDDWEITIPDLMREGKCGRDRIYRIIGELVHFGYLERVDVREVGKFSETAYHLHESPLPEKPYTAKPHTEKPYPAEPYTENPQQTNNVYSTKEEKSTKDEEGESAPPPGPAGDVDFWGNGGEEPIKPALQDPYNGKLKRGKVPANTGSTPAQVFHEIHPMNNPKYKLNDASLEEIAAVTDLSLWREVVRTWALRGYSAANIEGQMEWYRETWRFKGDSAHAGGSARASPNGAQRREPTGRHLRGAEKSMSLMDEFEAQFGDMEINP